MSDSTSTVLAPTLAGPVVTQQPAPKPSTPVAASSIAAGVNKAQGVRVPIPAGLVSKNTDDIVSPWARICIYGEIDSWKTVTAAHFAGPEDVRIIFTRGEDQLRGLTGEGYRYAECNNVQKLRHAILYPETIWPEWVNRPNRVVVIDDITRAKEQLVEDNEVDEQGRERKDTRAIHKGAKDDMNDLVTSLRMKPLHLIMVAQAKIYTNNITREETISPDIPPAMSNMLMGDASFIFFLDKSRKMMLTTQKRETYRAKNDKNVEETFTRTILARHKLPRSLEGKGVINEYEPIDLAALWAKIQAAKVGGAR